MFKRRPAATFSVLLLTALLSSCGSSGGDTEKVSLSVSVNTALPAYLVANRTGLVTFKVTSNGSKTATLKALTIPTSGDVTVDWQAPTTGNACRASNGTWATLAPGASCTQTVTLTGALNAKIQTPWQLTTTDGTAVQFSPASTSTTAQASNSTAATFVASDNENLPTLTADASWISDPLVLQPDKTYELKVTAPSTNQSALNNLEFHLASWLNATDVSTHVNNVAAGSSVTMSFKLTSPVDFNSHLQDIQQNAQAGNVLTISAANSKGDGIQPELVAQATPGELRSAELTAPNQAASLRFVNSGSGSLTITDVSGDLPSGVTLQSDGCKDQTISAGGTCTISYTATADAYGQSDITVSYKDANNTAYTNQAPVSVKPVNITLASNSDPIALGSSATITLTNDSSFNWQPSSTSTDYQLLNEAGSAASGLEITANSCATATSVAPNSSCSITVSASASAPAAMNDLVIKKGDGNLRQPAKLTFAVKSSEPSKLIAGLDNSTNSSNVIAPAVRRIKVTNVGSNVIGGITTTLASSTGFLIYNGSNGDSTNQKGTWCTSSTCSDRCTNASSLASGDSCYVYVYANPSVSTLTPSSGPIETTLTIQGSAGGATVLNLANQSVLYVVGNFTTSGDHPYHYVAKYANGTWSNLNTSAAEPIKFNHWSWAVTTTANGTLYTSGDFSYSGSNRYVAAYNGQWWTNLNLSAGTAGTYTNWIWPLVIGSDGNLYASGSVTNSAGKIYISRYDGSSWTDLNKGKSTAGQFNSLVNDVLEFSTGKLYVGGAFSQNDKAYVAYFDGSDWSNLNSGAGAAGQFNNWIGHLVRLDNGTLYVGGNFTNSNGSQFVAKYNGSTWSDLSDGIAAGQPGRFNNWIWQMVKDSNDNLYVAGNFTNSGGKRYVAKYNGSAWRDLNAGATSGSAGSLNDWVEAMVIAPNDDLYLGGQFTDSNDQYYVARYNSTNGSWQNINGSTDALNGIIYGLAVGNTLTITPN